MQTIRTNLKNNASTQYTNTNFKGMCRFNGQVIGAGASGLFRLGCGADDNGTDIAAYFTTPTTAFGIHDTKYERYVYLFGTWDGSLTVEVVGDDKTTVGPYTIAAVLTEGHQRRRTRIDQHMNYIYAKHTFRNVDGCDFSLDSAEAHVTVNSRRE